MIANIPLDPETNRCPAKGSKFETDPTGFSFEGRAGTPEEAYSLRNNLGGRVEDLNWAWGI